MKYLDQKDFCKSGNFSECKNCMGACACGNNEKKICIDVQCQKRESDVCHKELINNKYSKNADGICATGCLQCLGPCQCLDKDNNICFISNEQC